MIRTDITNAARKRVESAVAVAKADRERQDAALASRLASR